MKIEELRNRIVKGCSLSLARLLAEKKRTGAKLVTMLDGQIVHLSVEEYESKKAEGKI